MHLSRRQFLIHGGSCLASMLGLKNSFAAGKGAVKEFQVYSGQCPSNDLLFSQQRPVVSLVRVPDRGSEGKGIEYAVTRAVELIGGVGQVTRGKERILIKPNLVNPEPSDTTHPGVVEALGLLMKKAGKEVKIGEAGAASSANTNTFLKGYVCRTRDTEKLRAIQNEIFEKTGFRELSRQTGIPLVNLHLGDLVKVPIANSFVYEDLLIHKALADADMVCSVPMMKTHGLANVTLALKNVGMGCFPGMVYGTVRSLVHQQGIKKEPTGTSAVTIDMVRANPMGLTVIDAVTALEGQGPSLKAGSRLVRMNLIIASTNALAADMVAAAVMGFDPREIDTFHWAWRAGMTPGSLNGIRIRGADLKDVTRPFLRPKLIPYTMITDWYGPSCT